MDAPVAGPGEVVVDVERAGVCGTDIELFTGEMAYLHTGQARYPMRIGHEWCGVVTAVGADVDEGWIGRRVTGDTMLGCGKCDRCLAGRQHVCADRFEVGISGGWPGALAEQVAVPVRRSRRCPTRSMRRARWSSRAGTPARRVRRAGRARDAAARHRRRHDRAARGCSRRTRGARFISWAGASRSNSLASSASSTSGRQRRCPPSPGMPSSTRPTRRRAGPRRRAGRARRTVVFIGLAGAEPRRHSRDRAEGRHRGRHPERIGRDRRDGRCLRRPASSTRASWWRRRSASTRWRTSWPASAGPNGARRPRSTSIHDRRRVAELREGLTMAEFDGLVAVVTGGSSGIGAATARLLGERGASVAVLDLAPARGGTVDARDRLRRRRQRRLSTVPSARWSSDSAGSTSSSTTPASAPPAT